MSFLKFAVKSALTVGVLVAHHPFLTAQALEIRAQQPQSTTTTAAAPKKGPVKSDPKPRGVHGSQTHLRLPFGMPRFPSLFAITIALLVNGGVAEPGASVTGLQNFGTAAADVKPNSGFSVSGEETQFVKPEQQEVQEIQVLRLTTDPKDTRRVLTWRGGSEPLELGADDVDMTLFKAQFGSEIKPKIFPNQEYELIGRRSVDSGHY